MQRRRPAVVNQRRLISQEDPMHRLQQIVPRDAIIYVLAALALLSLAAVGCSSGEDAAAPAPEPTVAPTATSAPATATPEPEPEPTATAEPVDEASSAPLAPDLEKTGGWVNSDPFTLSQMQDEGKVVLIDFWDVHLHQLHPHAALPQGVERQVRRARTGHSRGAHAGVRVREGNTTTLWKPSQSSDSNTP